MKINVEGKRGRGTSKKSWLDTIDNDMSSTEARFCGARGK
jgi:hypothetical protein